jgi:hypothetical protein
MTPTALARTALALIRHGQAGDYPAFSDRLATLDDSEVRLIVPVLAGVCVQALAALAMDDDDGLETVTAAMEEAVLATAAEEEADDDGGA